MTKNTYSRRGFLNNLGSIAAISITQTNLALSEVLAGDLNFIDTETDVLLIIDMQNDFCPGGSLGVKGGDKIIPTINLLQEKFKYVVMTQDWHPKDHISFVENNPGKEVFSSIEVSYGNQTVWPSHCIQGTEGAEFHKDLSIEKACLVIRKGYRSTIDSYSAFWENDLVTPTGLEGALNTLGIKRVFSCGLALDFCVGFSAVDAARAGFSSYVIEDASMPVDLPETINNTYKAFKKNGVNTVDSKKIFES